MSETYEMQGAIKLIEETQTFASGFSKREFVITTEGKYPQDIKFECLKERIEQLNTMTVGAVVKVSFNIRGNEFKGRFYVNLQAWKIELLKAAPLPDGEIEENVPAPDSESGKDLEDSPF